jgi:ribose-phosphate pyrophosphokinase
MSGYLLIDLVRETQESSSLAHTLAHALGAQVCSFNVGAFADSEAFLEFSGVEQVTGKNIIIIDQYSIGRKEKSLNAQVFELLLVVDSLKKMKVASICALLPYMPYARHDASDLGLSTGLAHSVMSLFATAGIQKIITCDLHEPSIVSGAPLELCEIRLEDFWLEHFKSLGMKAAQCVFASPDDGGLERVRLLADKAGVSYVAITKERYGHNKTRSLMLDGVVEGKHVFLFDDILDTGGTAINACSLLMSKGALSVTGFFSHGVFSSDARERISKSSFACVYTTNSLLSASRCEDEKIRVLGLEHYIASALVEAHYERLKHE